MISLILNSIYAAPAEALIAAGKTEQAKELLNNALENMPERIYRIMDAYGYSFIAENLYAVGETDKANELIERNIDYLEDQLAYYLAIAETKSNLEMKNIKYIMFTQNRCSAAARENGQKALATRITHVII